MRTFVAVIAGEPILVFRAQDADDARSTMDDEDGGLQAALLDAVREDGSDLWDGEAPIEIRPATETEHRSWERDAKEGGSTNDNADPDDLIAYLIPVAEPYEEGPA